MMIQIPHAIGAGLFALSLMCPPPNAPEAPQAPKPACQLQVTLLDHITDETDCDLTPPQMLAARLDGGDGDMAACDWAGGAVLHDPKTNQFYCIDLDY